VATGKADSRGRPEVLLLATSRPALAAELVALAYKFRWEEGLFSRRFKCVLGRRHLVSESRAGLTVQVYVARIANLLLTLWAGKKPTKRTFEMFCLFFMGWASAEELQKHLERLKEQRGNSPTTIAPDPFFRGRTSGQHSGWPRLFPWRRPGLLT
jgi:hypothetical protein